MLNDIRVVHVWLCSLPNCARACYRYIWPKSVVKNAPVTICPEGDLNKQVSAKSFSVLSSFRAAKQIISAPSLPKKTLRPYYYYYKNRTRSTQLKKLAYTITQCKENIKRKKKKNTALTIHSLRTIRTYSCRNTHIYIIPI